MSYGSSRLSQSSVGGYASGQTGAAGSSTGGYAANTSSPYTSGTTTARTSVSAAPQSSGYASPAKPSSTGGYAGTTGAGGYAGTTSAGGYAGTTSAGGYAGTTSAWGYAGTTSAGGYAGTTSGYSAASAGGYAGTTSSAGGYVGTTNTYSASPKTSTAGGYAGTTSAAVPQSAGYSTPAKASAGGYGAGTTSAGGYAGGAASSAGGYGAPASSGGYGGAVSASAGYGSTTSAGGYGSTTSSYSASPKTSMSSPFSGQAQQQQPAAAWVLDPVQYAGQAYLVDRSTGMAYTNHQGFMQLAGQWQQGRLVPRARQNTGDLFKALDDLLRTQQVRFTDLFRRYDLDNSGTLEVDELRVLVKQLLPSVTEQELRYFQAMIDTGNRGGVDSRGFLQAAKECLEAENKVRSHHADVHRVLQRMSKYLRSHTDEAYASFLSLDNSGKERLEPYELLDFARSARLQLTSQELRYLIFYMTDMDYEGTGRTSWQGLLRALNVVDVQTGGVRTSGGTGSVSQGGTAQGSSVFGKEYEWTLTPVQDGVTQKRYLLDPETNFVYSQNRPSDWPQAVGRRDPSGQLRLQEQRTEKGLFAALDDYLRTTKTRFRDIFDSCDPRNLGYLDLSGLAKLLRIVLPNVTEGELYYYQVMLDVDGDGKIEYDEFMDTVKTSLATERNEAGGMSADTRVVMDKLASYLSTAVSPAKQTFDYVDSSRRGYLRYPDMAIFLKKVMPSLSPSDKRCVVSYLYSLDLDRKGHISFRQLMRYMSRAPGMQSSAPYPAGSPGMADERSLSRSSLSRSSSLRVIPGRDINASIDGGRTPLILRELHHGREIYLLDVKSGRVYSNAMGTDWPELVGTYDDGEIHFQEASAAASLFTSLDKYLKGAQVRFKELFDHYDRSRKGYLSPLELRNLVKEIMPGVAEGDLRYFQVMIDQNGDGKIELNECLSAAKEALEDEQLATNRSNVTVKEVLKRVSDFMKKNKSSLRELFTRFDQNRSGFLEPKDVMSLYKTAMPSLNPQELRFLLAHLHKIDLNKDGLISFSELMIAMKAFTIEEDRPSSGGYDRTEAMYKPKEEGYRPVSSGGYAGRDSYQADSGEWVLEDFVYRGQTYLLDKKTMLVYAAVGNSWPRLVGKFRDGVVVEQKRINPGDLFQRLDEFLKTRQIRLKDLFDRFDRDFDGELTMQELADMIRQQLPQVSRAELLYFQAMMDIDGNGRVSYDELLQTAKQSLEATKKMDDAAGYMPDDVIQVLDRVSQMCITSPAAVRKAFDRVDRRRTGSLDPLGIAEFLRELFKDLRPRDIHYLLQYLASLDVDGDGLLSFSELMTSLHAVTPRTNSKIAGSYTQGFSKPKTSAYSQRAEDPAAVKTSYVKYWDLDDHFDSSSRKRYLVDRKTGLLYSDVPASDWPSLVAVLIPASNRSRERIDPIDNAASTSEFFISLDTYLKNQRLRFNDVFNHYDTKRRGELGIHELKHLVKEIMPKATDAQILIFQIILDENGDKMVTSEEFLKAAKSALELMKATATDTAVAKVLDSMSVYLYKSTDEASRIWDSVDKERNGFLYYPQVADFFRQVDRRMTHEELTHLMCLVHTLDVDHSGKVTFQDVLRAVRAVDLRSPRGDHARGFKAVPGGGRKPHRTDMAQKDDFSPWVIEVYPGAARGREYLVDVESNILYSRPKSSSDYPVPIGRVEEDRRGGPARAVLYSKEAVDALQFFKVLDNYLKEQKLRFNELFQEFDRDRSGRLDSNEIRVMVQSLMPSVTETQLRYFQAMLDCGNDVSLTSEEFVKAAKQCLSVEVEAQSGRGVSPDVAQVLKGLSQYLIKNKVEAKEAFDRQDRQRIGRIEPREMLQLFRTSLRQPPSDVALRHVSVQLYLLFMNGDGTASFRELVKALRGVELRTPDFKFPPGQWAERKIVPPMPVLKSLKLNIFDYERKRFYIDKATGTVYEPITRHTTWPKPVGTYDAQRRSMTPKPPASNASDLFSALDQHLKTQRKHFSEVFAKYDLDGNGTLERVELAHLVQDLIGSKATAADLGYFQAILDLDGSNSVSQEEFLTVARTYVDLSKMATSAASDEVKEALSTCSKRLAANKDSVYDEFQRLDTDGDGRLTHSEVVDLSRYIMGGGPSDRQVQFILTWVHNCDADKVGLFTFNELLVSLRAIPVEYPGGKIEASTFDAPTTMGRTESAADLIKAVAPSLMTSSYQELAELKEVRLKSKTYLVNHNTGFVYEMTKGGEYPDIIGRMSEAGELQQPAYTKENDLFKKLDEYLKKNRVHLKEMFDANDYNGDGQLEATELDGFLSSVMPEGVSDAELKYFQTMMDSDGDGAISLAEMVAALKECWATSQSVFLKDKPEIVATLTKVSLLLKRDTAKALRLFQELDNSDMGKLAPLELAVFFKQFFPQLTIKERRYVTSHLHFVDVDGDGCLTFEEFAYLMHLPDLKLPSKVIIKGGQFKKPVRGRPSAPPSTPTRPSALQLPTAPVPEVREWLLESYVDDDSKEKLLLDPESNMVYVMDRTENWPLVFGFIDDSGGIIQGLSSLLHEFITRLDEELKIKQMKLRDFMSLFGITSVQGLSPDEFQDMIEQVIPGISEVQVKFLLGMLDMDGDKSVSPQEVLDVFKQMMQIGPKIQSREDPTAVAALNKLSDAASKDLKRAGRAFQAADQDGQGVLDYNGLVRFFRALAPTLKPVDLRAVLTHMQLLDLNGDGSFEFKEIICGLRAIPVRIPSGLVARAPFKLKSLKKAPSSGRVAGPSSPSRSHKPRLSDSGASRSSESSGVDDGHKKPLKDFSMELHAVKGTKLLRDDDNGLMYLPSTSRGRWPLLSGFTVHSESKGKDVIRELTPLSKLRLFEELCYPLSHTEPRKAVTASFIKAAKKAEADGEGGDVDLDGETLPPHLIIRFLQKKIKCEEPTQSPAWSVLEGLLALVGGGDPMNASQLIKALDKIRNAHKRLAEGDEDGSKVLAKVCRSIAAPNFADAARACRENECADHPGHLDMAGVLAVLQEVAELGSSSDKLLAALHLLLHCPHLESPGIVPFKDLFKAFRAVKVKLPGGSGSVAPGFTPGSRVKQRASSSFASDDEDDPIETKPVPKDVYDVIAKEAEKRREMEKREVETPLRRKDSSGGGGKIGWGSNTNLTETGKSSSLLSSLPRDVLDLPRMNSARRHVQLHEHRGAGGAQGGIQLLDKETGLLYRMSTREEWPELLGKLTPSGTALVGNTDVQKVFDAIRRISGDEKRMLQIFRTFDKDQSNSLELPEIMQMCRQLFSMSYNEACFVQAMLDTDLSNTVSIHEFMEGIKKTATSLDEVSRTESKVLEVLNQASQRIASDLDAFWSVYMNMDPEGIGYIDISQAAHFFKGLFHGVSGYELRMLVAYIFMRDISKDGLVRPDELLQHLQAIPMRSPSGMLYRPGFSLQGSRAAMADSMRSTVSRQLEWNPPTWASPAHSKQGTSMLDTFTQQLPGTRFDLDRPQTAPAAHYSGYPPGVHVAPSPGMLTQPPAYPGMPMMAAMQTTPGMPPVVGYIIPYEQNIFQQLQGDRASDGGSSQGSRRTRKARELALAEAARAMESDPEYSSEYDDEGLDYPPPDMPAASRRRPVTAPSGARFRTSSFIDQGYGYDNQPPHTGYRPPPPRSPYPPEEYGDYGQYPSAAPQGGYPPRAFRSSQEYAHADLMIDEAIVAGLESSDRSKGRRSNKWRTSQDLPPGQISVMADGSPHRRTTPYGLLQELQSFMGSRRDAFLNHWMMAAADAGNRGRSMGYLGSEPQIQKGLVSKKAVSFVIQRCVPGASDSDLRYASLMLDAALPKHTAISIEDMEYGIRQGAAIERLVAAGRLPPAIRNVISALAELFYSNQRQRVQLSFRNLDFNRTGMLTTSEQVELLRSLAPSLRHSEILWLAGGLHHYGSLEDRDGSLTFEELAEALVNLARVRGVESDGGTEGQRRGSPSRPRQQSQPVGPWPEQQQSAGYWTGQQQPGYGTYSPGYMAGPSNGSPYGGTGPYGMTAGPWAGSMGGPMASGSPSGGLGWSSAMDSSLLGGPLSPHPGAREAGAAYFTWVHDNRQKVLESWFAEDHARKVKMLEEQKTKLDQQKDLKAQAFQSQAEIRKTEQSLWELEKKVAMIGQPPRLDLEGITKRVSSALDEAIKLIRAKKLIDQGGGATLGLGGAEGGTGVGGSGGVSSLLEPGLTLDELLQRVTSPDWLRGTGMPRNAETLKVALEARNSLMELERMHQTKMMQMDFQQKCSELDAEEARHGMALQAQLMHSHLANQAADLQRRLLWDAANYQLLTQQHQLHQQQSAAQHRQQAVSASPPLNGPVSGPSATNEEGGGSPMRFSPTTWQMEPAPAGMSLSTRSGDLAAAFAAMPLPSSGAPQQVVMVPTLSSFSPAGSQLMTAAGLSSPGIWGGNNAGRFLVPSPTSD